MKDVRRLGPEKPDLDRTLRALEEWVAEWRGAFVEPPEGQPIATVRPPVPTSYEDGPELEDIRRAIAQAHVDVTANLIAARPAELAHARVTAIMCAPQIEWSEVCVFFDLEYFRTFEVRDHEYQRWTPLPPDRSFAREAGLRLPAGLRERGYRNWDLDPDDDPPRMLENEVWMIGDQAPG